MSTNLHRLAVATSCCASHIPLLQGNNQKKAHSDESVPGLTSVRGVLGRNLLNVASCSPITATPQTSFLHTSRQRQTSPDEFSCQYDWRRQHMMNSFRVRLDNLKYFFGLENPNEKTGRKKLVVLGTGWASLKFVPNVDVSKYDVTIISPRNFFTFTPLLPSVCAGTLDGRCCMEPIRRWTRRGGKKVIEFYEGRAQDIDFDKDILTCVSNHGKKFEVPFDYLVTSVGSEVNTFGIPGVKEHVHFLKEVENASGIHSHILENFERAILPGCSEAEQRRLLSFIIVGGGPSGVETAAELADFIKLEARKFFPELVEKVHVTLIEMLPRMLPTFSDEVSSFTLKNFQKLGIDALLRTRVTKITDDAVHVSHGDKSDKLPYGFILWASGVGQVPFSKKLMEKIPAQQKNRVLRVNQNLRVEGVGKKNIFALGDCSWLTPPNLSDRADELYETAKESKLGAGTAWLKSKQKTLLYTYPQLSDLKYNLNQDRNYLSKQEFKELLRDIDSAYRPPAPTAQNARQAGEFLATVFNEFHDKLDSPEEHLPAFVERWRGAMAYVGDGESVAQLPWTTLLGGLHTNVFWKAVYWSMQMSIQNRVLLFFDWIRLLLKGREIGRPHLKDATSERKEMPHLLPRPS